MGLDRPDKEKNELQRYVDQLEAENTELKSRIAQYEQDYGALKNDVDSLITTIRVLKKI